MNYSYFFIPLSVASMNCASIKAQQIKDKKPNVLFIAIDDMNDWTTLFDENNPIKTPNLIRLAKQGVFFSQAYCASAASCPSRAAIMTGIAPYNSGVYDNNHAWAEMIPNAVTLPRHFMLNGYKTFGAGKIFHHGDTGHDIPGQPSFENLRPFQIDNNPANGINYNGYTDKPLSEAYYDWGEQKEKMVDLDMVNWIDSVINQPDDMSCFWAAGIFKPHLPFYADPETFERYPFDQTQLPVMPENDLDDVPEIAKRMAHRESFIYDNVTKGPQDRPGSLKKMIQCYQASADFADQMVGKLMDNLEASGKAENTIIVLWADHGYHLGDKESCVKFTLWEKANHVPFIIVAPGLIKPGIICTKPVSLLDIYPTLIELIGLSPADVDGRSLLPLIQEPMREWEPAIMTMGKGNHAVRSDRWRYIRYNDGSEELYDQDKDPWNLKNLAKKSKYKKIIAEHRKWLPKDF